MDTAAAAWAAASSSSTATPYTPCAGPPAPSNASCGPTLAICCALFASPILRHSVTKLPGLLIRRASALAEKEHACFCRHFKRRGQGKHPGGVHTSCCRRASTSPSADSARSKASEAISASFSSIASTSSWSSPGTPSPSGSAWTTSRWHTGCTDQVVHACALTLVEPSGAPPHNMPKAVAAAPADVHLCSAPLLRIPTHGGTFRTLLQACRLRL